MKEFIGHGCSFIVIIIGQLFYYYILYKLGQSDIQNLNDEVVKQFIIALFNTRNIDSRKVNLREKLEEMLDEEDYSKLIKLGADKIRKWQFKIRDR